MVLTPGGLKNLRDPIDLDHRNRLPPRRRSFSLNAPQRW
jgi:hypothetical protein